MSNDPLLQPYRLKHLTLKYFEVFCADTIPLLMLDEWAADDAPLHRYRLPSLNGGGRT